MSVKRYDWVACDEHACHCDVVESTEGDMVDYEDYAALEQRLIESERYGRQTDITIDNLEMKLAQMAAENAGLRAALRPSYIPCEWTDAFGDTAVIEHDATGDNQGHSVSWSWVGNQEEVIKSVLLAVDNGIETPSTDAFMAEVRAQGVEQLASLAGNECQRYKSVNDRAGVRKWKSIVILCSDFAAQIRKGTQS